MLGGGPAQPFNLVSSFKASDHKENNSFFATFKKNIYKICFQYKRKKYDIYDIQLSNYNLLDMINLLIFKIII